MEMSSSRRKLMEQLVDSSNFEDFRSASAMGVTSTRKTKHAAGSKSRDPRPTTTTGVSRRPRKQRSAGATTSLPDVFSGKESKRPKQMDLSAMDLHEVLHPPRCWCDCAIADSIVRAATSRQNNDRSEPIKQQPYCPARGLLPLLRCATLAAVLHFSLGVAGYWCPQVPPAVECTGKSVDEFACMLASIGPAGGAAVLRELAGGGAVRC